MQREIDHYARQTIQGIEDERLRNQYERGLDVMWVCATSQFGDNLLSMSVILDSRSICVALDTRPINMVICVTIDFLNDPTVTKEMIIDEMNDQVKEWNEVGLGSFGHNS